MQTNDLSYRNSPLAHMCFLVSEALRGPGPDVSPSRDEQPPCAPSALARPSRPMGLDA